MWVRSAASALAMTADQSTGAVSELAEARARHDAVVEEMRAYFDAEVAALMSELAQAYALMERLRTLNAFAQYQRSETDTIN
jgi:hypothetical protein